MMDGSASALDIAATVRTGDVLCRDLILKTLDTISARDGEYNSFVSLNRDRALSTADAIDAARKAGTPLGPLAGVPYAVKDLFDVKGEITKAGAGMRENAPAARRDALLVRRLNAAGAINLGRLNMDEFAYGFATVNARYGTTKNPYNTQRLAGGSSGGSAAAVAAGLVPLTLGSDTNGSVRVPASLCGLFGLRPSFDGLPMSGVFPFVDTLDTAGPFTRTIEELAAVYWVLSKRKPPKRLKQKLKVARLDGWFRQNGDPDSYAGVDAIAAYFGKAPLLKLQHAEAGRSAAFLITSKAGGLLHLDALQNDPMGYDPAVRDRLVAGCALDGTWVAQAKAMSARANGEIYAALSKYDLLIAPATPSVAPKISDGMIEIDGKPVSARANLGLYTQPLSPAGVPILTVPLKRPGKLPLGIQLIAKAGREPLLFEVAKRLVAAGLIGYSAPVNSAMEAHA